jgi:hypothetical protein
MSLFATSTTTHAQDCQSIQDPQARLACYDKAAKSKQPTKKTRTTDEFAAAKRAVLKKLVDPESARWGEFWHGQGTSGPVICGFVNAKNRMGGYDGMRGFVYVPSVDQSILLFSGEADPNWAATGVENYCAGCLGDPRADTSIAPYCPRPRR